MTGNEENLLLDLCDEYQKRRKNGMTHEEACWFQGLLPEMDGFLEGLFGLTEALDKEGMVRLLNENAEYRLTKEGIDYIRQMRKKRPVYYALRNMKKALKRWKKKHGTKKTLKRWKKKSGSGTSTLLPGYKDTGLKKSFIYLCVITGAAYVVWIGLMLLYVFGTVRQLFE